MKKKIPYQAFSRFVLRTPLLPFSFYQELTGGATITDQQYRRLAEDPVIREALFLASPSLYQEMKRWLSDTLEDKKIPKFKMAFLKYLTRMSSRCTPFGLFAGCSVGRIGEETRIQLQAPDQNRRHTRLDMNFLVALSQTLGNHPQIQPQLLFYPNSSLYPVGDQFRYVEYKYINSQRHHHIAAVDASDYLQQILDRASNGARLATLAKELVDDEISFEEAAAFIEELIDNQLLVSELEPSVSGPEFLSQIQAVLSKLEGVDNWLEILQHTEKQCRQIDGQIGNLPESYIELSEYLKQLDTDFELKYMFQTDLVVQPKESLLSQATVEQVKKGFALLNRLSLSPAKTFMSEFKEAFYGRYEEREVALAHALDVEMGVGYRQDQSSEDDNPLLDGLNISRPPEKNARAEVQWSRLDDHLHNRLIEAWKTGAYCVQLKEEEFKDLEEEWDDLPDTVTLTLEVLKIEGEERVRLRGGGGSSGACLLGRFGHSDAEMLDHLQEIVEVEKQCHPDHLLAEIVHLPESRVGNVLMRPLLRNYEIPYLARSIVSKDQQLDLSDLYISVPGAQRVRLRSKRYDKEIIPRLSNAHNYITNALPIYHFLGDLQVEGLRDNINLFVRPIGREYTFVPRIEYEGIILRVASWQIKKAQIQPMVEALKDWPKLKALLDDFREQYRIPRYCMLVDGDNELLINFDNHHSCQMLLNTVKSRDDFKLTEFLFGEEGIVKGKEDRSFHTHQIALSFYHTRPKKNN